MNLSPSVVKKLSSEKQIDDLADADLSAIFERLPPLDRLIASEVCRRWNGFSRNAWLDVTELDLSLIPGEHIGIIVRQCPNLRSVFACKKFFDVNELSVLSKSSSLSSVKLYHCTFAVASGANSNVVHDAFATIFSEYLQHVSWSECILHDASVLDSTFLGHNVWAVPGALLPDSLTRLQLSGLEATDGDSPGVNLCFNALRRLQRLECLILHHTPDCHVVASSESFKSLIALQNLKELYLGSVFPAYQRALGRMISSLPLLEVLFLNDINGDEFEIVLNELLTKNSVLRILVLSGTVFRRPFNPPPLKLLARKRFPYGLGYDPLPLLHVFVGKQASEQFHFATSSSDAAIIHPINEPMPQFFEREDIAPIFDGVWVAEKIKEAAKNGCELLKYDG